MELYIALMLIAPLAVMISGDRSVRRGLIVTTAITFGVALAADAVVMDEPWEIWTSLVFLFFVLHLICGVVSGVLAALFVGKRRTFLTSIFMGFVGSVLGLILMWKVGPTGIDLATSAKEVLPSAVIASAFAVAAAAIGSKPT